MAGSPTLGPSPAASQAHGQEAGLEAEAGLQSQALVMKGTGLPAVLQHTSEESVS